VLWMERRVCVIERGDTVWRAVQPRMNSVMSSLVIVERLMLRADGLHATFRSLPRRRRHHGTQVTAFRLGGSGGSDVISIYTPAGRLLGRATAEPSRTVALAWT
jgi:hypothetical protein